MGRKPAIGKCPDGRPHHWIIDCLNHGLCILCRAERNFPWVPEFGRMVAASKESASRGGKTSRRVPVLNMWQ